MNYITRLQAEAAQLTSERDALLDGITELRAYLTSDKFSEDNTVQCRDVLNRLTAVLAARP